LSYVGARVEQRSGETPGDDRSHGKNRSSALGTPPGVVRAQGGRRSEGSPGWVSLASAVPRDGSASPFLAFAGLTAVALADLPAVVFAGLAAVAFAGLAAVVFAGLAAVAFAGLAAVVFAGLAAVGFAGLAAVVFAGLAAVVFAGLAAVVFAGRSAVALADLAAAAFRGAGSCGAVSVVEAFERVVPGGRVVAGSGFPAGESPPA
jgi:hypothetical protein